MSRVRLVGGDVGQAAAWALAWSRSGFEVADDAELLHLVDPDPDLALVALRRGDSVLTALPIDPVLATTARASVGLLEVARPWRWWPPMLRFVDRLPALGKLSIGRCRVLGSADPRRELLERTDLLTALLGPIEEFCVQRAPSTTLVTFKHVGRQRFSSVELARAPGLVRDDDLELTGSAGVIWLHGGPGLPRAPALELHLGGRLRSEAADATWQDALDGCVAAFAAALRSRRQPDLGSALHASAVAALSLARSDGRRHRIPGGPP